jgi:hypothetical protein
MHYAGYRVQSGEKYEVKKQIKNESVHGLS